jgi:hypothetical protein
MHLSTCTSLVAALMLTHVAVNGADVSRFAILKGEHYTQTSYRGPVNAPTNGYRLAVTITPTVFNTLSSASLQTPYGPTQPLSGFPQDGEWRLNSGFDTSAALNAAFPEGSYALQITSANDGTKNIPCDIVANDYPNAPRISNFIAAQMVFTNNAFLLTWDPFVGGTTNDYIYVQVYDLQRSNVRLESPALGQAGALDGTATGFIVPARTLQAGRDYPSHVIFVKGHRDTTSYPGGTGIGGHYRRTDFLIHGVNKNDVIPATLIDSTLLSDGRFQFTVVGMANQTYVLSHTTDYLVWTPFLTNNAPAGGTFNVIDPTLPGSTPRFYRAESR